MHIAWAVSCLGFEKRSDGYAIAGVATWGATVEQLGDEIPFALFAALEGNHTVVGQAFEMNVTFLGPDLVAIQKPLVDRSVWVGDPERPSGWSRILFWAEFVSFKPPIAGTYTIQLRLVPERGEPGAPYDIPFRVQARDTPAV